jgi:hypothetical protein
MIIKLKAVERLVVHNRFADLPVGVLFVKVKKFFFVFKSL